MRLLLLLRLLAVAAACGCWPAGPFVCLWQPGMDWRRQGWRCSRCPPLSTAVHVCRVCAAVPADNQPAGFRGSLVHAARQRQRQGSSSPGGSEHGSGWRRSEASPQAWLPVGSGSGNAQQPRVGGRVGGWGSLGAQLCAASGAGTAACSCQWGVLLPLPQTATVANGNCRNGTLFASSTDG